MYLLLSISAPAIAISGLQWLGISCCAALLYFPKSGFRLSTSSFERYTVLKTKTLRISSATDMSHSI